MNEEQAQNVRKVLDKIQAVQVQYEADMKRLRAELLGNVQHFDTYGEMYSFIKQNTPDLATFNRDMLDATRIFWENHE